MKKHNLFIFILLAACISVQAQTSSINGNQYAFTFSGVTDPPVPPSGFGLYFNQNNPSPARYEFKNNSGTTVWSTEGLTGKTWCAGNLLTDGDLIATGDLFTDGALQVAGDAYAFQYHNGSSSTNFGLYFSQSQAAYQLTDGTGSPVFGVRGNTGDVSFTGALQPNGDAGTAGYVLQSQGAGAPPIWVAGGAGGPGPTGPTGPTGAIGPQGPTGAMGVAGPQGPTGATGPLVPGVLDATLRYDGSSWVGSNTLLNNGTEVGAGSINTNARLNAVGQSREAGVRGQNSFNAYGYLGVQGSPAWSDDTTMNINGQEIGVLGLSIGTSSTDNFGVVGVANNWGGRFEHSTDGNQVRLGGSTYSIEATGDVKAQSNIEVDGQLGVGTVPSYPIHVTSDALRSAYFLNSYAGASTKYGIYNTVTVDGGGIKYGIRNYVYQPAAEASTAYGSFSTVDHDGTGSAIGYYASVSGTTTGNEYGFYANMSGGVSDNEYGIYTIGEGKNYFSNNVGINNTNPEARLHVSNGSDIVPGTGGGYVIVGQTSVNHLRLDGNEIAVLNGGDNLNPGNLFINDQGNTTVGADVDLGAALAVQDDDATGYAFRVRVGSATEMLVWENGGTSLGTNSTNPPADGLYVLGNVHVGNVAGATGYKMAVDGKVICEELRVETSGSWPDYVFDEDYDLPTLEEVEQHIKQNSHLPGIPPACEVESEGILVGEMQTRMMEKIEELVLYTIQQQKDHERQQQEIELLKEQNAKLQALLSK